MFQLFTYSYIIIRILLLIFVSSPPLFQHILLSFAGLMVSNNIFWPFNLCAIACAFDRSWSEEIQISSLLRTRKPAYFYYEPQWSVPKKKRVKEISLDSRQINDMWCLKFKTPYPIVSGSPRRYEIILKSSPGLLAFNSASSISFFHKQFITSFRIVIKFHNTCDFEITWDLRVC